MRVASGEHRPPEHWALLQRLVGAPHGVELGEAESEAGGEGFGRFLLPSPLGPGQQQPRLEVGEPGGHQKIVSGDHQVAILGGADEGEVLVGEAGDRNLQQIDPLRPSELEKDIQRAFPDLQVDDEDLLAARGDLGGLEGDRSGHRTKQVFPAAWSLAHSA